MFPAHSQRCLCQSKSLAAARGSAEIAKAYLEFLYTPEGQEIAAKHHFRPRLKDVAAKHADEFPSVELFTVNDVAGGWREAQSKHFNDGGVFDKIYESNR